MGVKWVKVWVETAGDKKVRTLSPETRWGWIGVLLLAGDCERGELTGRLEMAPGLPMCDEEIADFLALSLDSWLLCRARFLALGLLLEADGCLIVAHWKDRQDSPEAARKRRQRAGQSRDSHADSHGKVTVTVTPEAEAEGTTSFASSNTSELPKRKLPEPPSWALAIAEFIAGALSTSVPNCRPPTPANLAQWARQVDMLHRIDGVPIAEIEAGARWAMGHAFWGRTIQSGEGLRKHWNRVAGQMAEKGNNGKATTPNAPAARSERAARYDAADARLRNGSGGSAETPPRVQLPAPVGADARGAQDGAFSGDAAAGPGDE